MITKTTKNLNEADFAAGEVILIDKHSGITSFGIIHKIRRMINVKKVGHAGTLDPLATGLLIVCTGKKTKEISSFQDLQKVYSGIITLGIQTPSMDGETEPDKILPTDQIAEAQLLDAQIKLSGEIEQIPPMYSALKHKGKALYKFARKGTDVKREPRKIKVYEFKITKINMPDVHFKITCSKGTYIRVIANDFGNILGCGGYLKNLRREKIGEYSVDDALTIEGFKEFFNVQQNN